jgi:hypothetical protein
MMKTEQRDMQHTSGQRSFRFWFYLGLAAVLLIWSNAAHAEEVAVTDSDGSLWTININPAAPRIETLVPPLPEPETPTEVASVDKAMVAPLAATAAQVDGIVIEPRPTMTVNELTYAEVYRSIPYSRTEYVANPSYRHDATMEVLFGQLRPGGGSGHGDGQVIQNPVYTPYRPYLYAQWDLFQTSTLLHPRYFPPLFGLPYWGGYY